MITAKQYEIIIIGGSYSGLAAALTLGRSLRNVLVIDSNDPCNRQTPHSHNFLTQDGNTPASIAMLAKQQLRVYSTVTILNGLAVSGRRLENGFEIQVATGEIFSAAKLIFATGIRDIMPSIDGFAACWGISVIHCPYCHGYEVRNEKTGILANGDTGFEFARLISNWTNDLTLFTDGHSLLTAEQAALLKKHQIRIVNNEIDRIEHRDGQMEYLAFKDGGKSFISALYAPLPFEQHCHIPKTLGCELNDDGYIRVDNSNKTTMEGIYCCGDNMSRIRTLANAVAMGTATAIALNKEMIIEGF